MWEKSERVSGVSVCGEKLRVSMLGEKVREEKDRLWVCHERERESKCVKCVCGTWVLHVMRSECECM